MTKGKITAIAIAVVLLFLSIFSIGLYLILPEKITDITVFSGRLANVTDEDEKWVITIDYHSNHNNTGVEMFEAKISQYISDEQIDAEDPTVYAKGIQIVGDKEGSIQFDLKYEEDWVWLNLLRQSTAIKTYKTNNSTYYYDTQNGFSFASAENISSDSMFKISIGSEDDAELYLMKFLGTDGQFIESEAYNKALTPVQVKNNYDLNWFLAKMLQVCRSNNIGYGADGHFTGDLGELFAYKKYSNGSYTGDWLTASGMPGDKLITNFTNYFTIRITTHENGATKASDSMFKMIQGKQDYEALDGRLADNYFHGEQVLTLTENDFDFVNTSYEQYQIKFKTETVNRIKNEQLKSTVNIVLNDNILLENGIKLETNTNWGVIFKDEAYYSISSKIGTITVQHTNRDGSISTSEVIK